MTENKLVTECQKASTAYIIEWTVRATLNQFPGHVRDYGFQSKECWRLLFVQKIKDIKSVSLHIDGFVNIDYVYVIILVYYLLQDFDLIFQLEFLVDLFI